MKEAHQIRYWMEALGCSKYELAAAVARWGIQLMQYGVTSTDIGHTGHSDQVARRRKKHRDADEDGRATERKPPSFCASSSRTPPSQPRGRWLNHCTIQGRRGAAQFLARMVVSITLTSSRAVT
jgi:Protein of unknown function (DUF3606)